MGGTIYFYRWSGPGLIVEGKGERVEVKARFLEYYLGVDEIDVVDLGSGVAALRATRGAGNYVDGLAIEGRPTVPQLRSVGWLVQIPQGNESAVLQQGRAYSLTLRGNNGFGYWNRSSCTATVSSGAVNVSC